MNTGHFYQDLFLVGGYPLARADNNIAVIDNFLDRRDGLQRLIKANVVLGHIELQVGLDEVLAHLVVVIDIDAVFGGQPIKRGEQTTIGKGTAIELVALIRTFVGATPDHHRLASTRGQ